MLLQLLPPILMVLQALLVAAAVAALALAGFELYQRFSQRYLATLGVDHATVAPHEASADPGSMHAVRQTAIAFLAVLNERFVPPQYLRTLGLKLRKAGHPGEFTASEMVALMEIGALSFLVMGVLVSIWLDFTFLTWPIFAIVGALYPLIWLRDKINQRHHAITRALPYNLDLLTLSVEAGLDFAAAIGKVVEKGRRGPLADELGITLRELKLGKTREEALRNLSDRVDLQTLTTFVNALIQADKMGTSLGKILRIISTQMRIERSQRAEKLANEAPVKMLLPLIGFIFPTIFIMLFGPIIYSVMFSP